MSTFSVLFFPLFLTRLKLQLSAPSWRPKRTTLSTNLAGERGVSLMEMLVAVTLIGLLSALALPNFNSTRSGLKLTDAVEDLAGNIRTARANATSRGARYRVTLYTDRYEIQRLQDVDDVWEPDGAAQEFQLPSGITISEGAGAVIEFTTRGLMPQLPDGSFPDVVTIRLNSASESQNQIIDVWPSGQVQRV